MKIIKDFDSFINEAETATTSTAATSGVSELDQLLSKDPSELQFFSRKKEMDKPQVIGLQGTVKDSAGNTKNVFLDYDITASYDKYFNFPVELANITTAKQAGKAWGPGAITGFAKPYPGNSAADITAHKALMLFVPATDKKIKDLNIKYAVCDADDDVKGKIKLSNGTYVYPAAEASWYNISDSVGDWMFFWVGQDDIKNALASLKNKRGASAFIKTPSGVKLTLTRKQK